MLRVSLRTLLIVSVVAALLIGYYREPLARLLDVKGNQSPLHVIASDNDMADALSSQNAVIFAHVDWSINSVIANDIVNEFARDWRRRNTPKVSFYFLDLTDAQQNAPNYVSDWIDSDSRLSGLPVRGSGDVVWLQDGILQEWHPAWDSTVDSLATRTKKIFKP